MYLQIRVRSGFNLGLINLNVCVNIVKTIKCVPVSLSRNVLILIYDIEPLKRVLHFQHLIDQYYHVRKH